MFGVVQFAIVGVALMCTPSFAKKVCSNTVDPGPQVRAGDDYMCTSIATQTECIAACCADAPHCRSWSYNVPWALNGSYMGCEHGKNCCCLKDAVPPLENSTWPMKIYTGVVVADVVCNQTIDCSLNGECDLQTGKCVCDAAWKGDDCAQLNLIPADSLDGAYQHTVVNPAVATNTSSWGGLPLKGPDGKYHLFASQFVQNCTLGMWNPASTVIRAVADNPFGPFTFAETVLGTFHHNPTVRKLSAAQSGTGAELYVIYTIGVDAAPPTGSGDNCGQPGGQMDVHHLEGYITMAWSDSIFGPWNQSKHTLITRGAIDRWDAMVTNPSPLFPFENETAYLFFRGTQWPASGYERIGLTKAASWKGPYGRVSEDAIFTGRQDDPKTFVEDPSIWKDHKGRGYKGLFHGHFDENGYYAFAENIEGPWTFRDTPAYTNVVEMSGGKPSQALVQRERPQIFFDEITGEPSILFTGVAPPGAKFYGYTYTFAQRINMQSHK
eukprot:m.13662 g.13662  ORF g.13662 m.13662 type:complete len:495 (+) comp9802_c0_seq1:147-1631(+)